MMLRSTSDSRWTDRWRLGALGLLALLPVLVAPALAPNAAFAQGVTPAAKSAEGMADDMDEAASDANSEKSSFMNDDGTMNGEGFLVVADAMVIRPLRAVRAVVGAGFFLGASPLLALGMIADDGKPTLLREGADFLVMQPIESVYGPKLGEEL